MGYKISNTKIMGALILSGHAQELANAAGNTLEHTLINIEESFMYKKQLEIAVSDYHVWIQTVQNKQILCSLDDINSEGELEINKEEVDVFLIDEALTSQIFAKDKAKLWEVEESALRDIFIELLDNTPIEDLLS